MIVIQGRISTKMTSDPNTYKMMYHRFFRSFVIVYNLFLQSTLSIVFCDKFCVLACFASSNVLTISFICIGGKNLCVSFSHIIGSGLVSFRKIGMSLFIFWLVILSSVSYVELICTAWLGMSISWLQEENSKNFGRL